jgi:hypothetical protein
MRILGLFATLILHPYLVPLYGYLIYQTKAVPNTVQGSFWFNSIKILMLTVGIPVLGKIMAQQAKIFQFTPKLNKIIRLIPSLLFVLGLILIVNNPLAYGEHLALRFFLLGLILANITQIIVSLTGNYIDNYLVGWGTLISFVCIISYYFIKDLKPILITCIMLCGILASLRAYFIKKGYASLFSGFALGILSQLSILKFWFLV